MYTINYKATTITQRVRSSKPTKKIKWNNEKQGTQQKVGKKRRRRNGTNEKQIAR